ncbi:hypothetical protein [Pectobacterium brasiliense]|uniref:hypothetical protein n=1 Tax=Pectobacterium brasiliense TaxID=180957 RepID=UPI001969501A|nr:hypothetical protein [Pectobacterium brasiliense]MBN3159446.1 hypothetical protein [Pectobacterium brasiliense]
MDELKKSLENAIAKRFDSPLFGFVLLSWLATNWSNIFYLFLSEKKIEERIKTITNLNYMDCLFSPVFIGVALAIIYPYAQILLDNLQRKAMSIRFAEEKSRLKVAYETMIELSSLKARAESADEDANKKIQNEKEILKKKQEVELELIEVKKLADEAIINQEKETKIKKEQEKQFILDNKIEELVKSVADMKTDLLNLEGRINSKEKQLEEINKEYELTVESVKKIIEKVKSYNSVSDSKGLYKVTSSIVSIINHRMLGFKDIIEMTGAEFTNVINANDKFIILNKSKDDNAY